MGSTDAVLTSKAVDELFKELLYKTGENTDGHVPVQGVTLNVGFHPDRLNEHKGEIKKLLNELPDQFRESGGGGWTFLNMCIDKHGNQWTGLHMVQDQLLMLGLASGYVEYLMGREFWKMLPGGMPYIVVKDEVSELN